MANYHRISCALLAISLAVIPFPGRTVLPAVMLGRQILQNIIIGDVKDQMFGALANRGCKGAHLAGLLATVDVKKAYTGGMMPSGMPRGMPGGMVGKATSGGMVDALQHASAKDRQIFLGGFGTGMYPAPVVEKVRARMAEH